jgi:Tfp pilus assembly protein PilV
MGTGLIEVLVLIFVMAIGMLAMGKMHTVLIRDGGTANNRAIATSLAQEKLDDLRGYKWLNASEAAANGDNCADAAIFCFSEIADNAGGVIPSGNVVIGNTTFNVTWLCFLTDTATTCPNPSDNVTFKSVTATVAWTDQNGAHSVVLQSAIVKDDAMLAAFSSGGGGSAGGYGPKVEYTPGVAPDIVAVPIMQGSVNKETSKPLPDVVSAGSSVATSFETVTYALGSPDYKQVLDDFITVSCVCKFTDDGSGYPASYYYYDSDAKTLKIKYPADADMVSTHRGVPGVNGQHTLCTKCCRDHHDLKSDTSTALFDPSRPSGDYTDSGNGDHKHYFYADGTGANPALGLSEVTVADDAKYLEACRFLRVDGFYRLLQDWYSKDLIVMPKENYLTNASTLSTYQTYVRNVLRYHLRADCSTAGGTGCDSISQASAPAKSALVERNISNASGSQQLLARAIYLDRVYGEDAPRTLDGTYYTALAAKIVANQADPDKVWLDIVPFNEVNATLLTSWYSSDGSKVSVTNAPIADVTASDANYYGVYSRGLYTVNAGGNANIYAVLLPSTSGLTGGAKQGTYTSTVDYDPATLVDTGTAIPYSSEIGIDRHDHSMALRQSDSINISTTTSAGISGEIRLGNAMGSSYFSVVAVKAIRTSDSSEVACTLSGEGNVKGFSCAVSSGFTGRLQIIQTTGTGAFFDYGTDTVYDTESTGGYQYESPEIVNVTGPTSGGVFWLFSHAAEVRGSVACSTDTICNQVEATTSTGGTCIIGGGAVTCPVTLDASTKLWSGTVTLANKSGFSNYLSASAATCSATDGTGAKTTGSLVAGPTDLPSALTFCATSGTVLAPCTLGSTTVQSGESLTAYLTATVLWPGTCSSQQRVCSDGTLSGSYTYDSCNPVAVSPAPSWTGTLDPKYLTWSAITGATGYKVYTCTTTGNNNLTACLPSSTPTTTVSTTTYAPAPANKNTICVNIRATTGSTDSAVSGTFCIHVQGSTYSYTPTP